MGTSKKISITPKKEGQINHAMISDEVEFVSMKVEADTGQSSVVDNEQEAEEEPFHERAQWTNQMEFLMSCIAMTVGFGNIWRFPFVAYDNGGGAFLIPYLIVLVFLGKPLYFLEMVLGQFSSCGTVKLWDFCPALRGVGFGQALSAWLVLTFYVSLMGLCVHYFVASFSDVLPWATCGSWASGACFDAHSTTNITTNQSFLVPSAEEYFKRIVLKSNSLGFENGLGLPDLNLSMCLFLSWVVIFLIQIKGVKSTGKAAYFNAIFPYVILLVMLIRGLTLPGAFKGVLYFVTPRWEKLLDLRVWYAAVDQSFFSLTIGFGTVGMYSSYDHFRQNIYRDVTIITFMDTFTCIFGGITIFSILGHLSELLGVEIEEVVRGGGTPLAFVSYPDALARFEYVPQLFSALFFFMLFILGNGGGIGYNQMVITIISDEFPHLKQWKVTLVVSIVGFVVGLIYTIPEGQHILTLINAYACGMPIILLAFLEVVAITWIYGINNFLRDIEFMLHRKMGIYWKASWVIIIPLFLAINFFYGLITFERLNYGSYVFDDVSTYTGVTMAIFIFSMVPLHFFILLIKEWDKNCTLWRNMANLFQPNSKWGPKDSKLRQEYITFKCNYKQSINQ